MFTFKTYFYSKRKSPIKGEILLFARITFENILEDIIRRDENDMNRAVAPLKKADDAVEIDSTSMSLDEVTEKIYHIVLDKI